MHLEPREGRPSGSFQEFFRTEAAGGALLVVCAAAALVIANSRWASAYHALWTTPIGLSVGSHALSLSAHQWINDGPMAIFFLLVGLEIKREAIAGELASPRQATLPIAAAIGGMAIVDDMGAVLVIVSGSRCRCSSRPSPSIAPPCSTPRRSGFSVALFSPAPSERSSCAPAFVAAPSPAVTPLENIQTTRRLPTWLVLIWSTRLTRVFAGSRCHFNTLGCMKGCRGS